VLRGDDEAFRKIVKHHQGRIFYLGLKFFRNSEDAEDFSQDVFLRAYQRLNTFGGSVPFSAWLYRLAYNVAVNRYRVRTRDVQDEGAIDTAESAELLPEEGVINEEMKTAVEHCLKKLPDTYNIVLKMHYYDGLTYPEISEITDIPVNTLKSHIRRAKQLLETLIGKVRGVKNEKK
jgi:RNA polymerase sigma-70 factor (ECF subfamily)